MTSIGFKTAAVGTNRSSEPHIINSVQWDQVKYQCDTLTGEMDNTVYECVISDPLICPGEESDFWWSIYNPDNQSAQARIDEMKVTDETGNNYTIEIFNVSGLDAANIRITSDPNYAPHTYFFAFATIAPINTGECIWDYAGDKANMPRAKSFNS